jgi:hypothetical protein
MSWRRLLVVLAVQLSVVLPASAGIFFNRKAKADPAQRVPELIATLKGDSNDHKREAAAEELRDFDPKTFPEILGVLMDVAQHDAKPEVRAEAVQSLGRLRPVSQEVGFVLEQVHSSDNSPKVRWHARTALWQYELAGYRSAKAEGPKLDSKNGGAPVLKGTTKEPPLATPTEPAPRIAPTPMSSPTGSRPLPGGPPLVPADPSGLQAPPDGPPLK